MKSIFSKILISFFALGIFLMPVSNSLEFKKEKISFSIKANIAFADPDQFWLAYEVPLVGIRTEGFGEDETACKNKMAEMEKVGNKIKTPCFKGQKPNFNILGQQREPTFEDTIDCNIASPFRCVVLIFYKIFTAFAVVARGAASILDFFIEYSLKSSSYKNTFIDAAWGTVRDIANIFFLLGLLYVAIQLVLDIHVSEKKKMIGQIIIMALLVNFSLFATQVIIDSSNILARVFYTQITQKNTDPNNNTPKPITESLVSTFQPQNLITSKDVSGGQMFAVILIAIAIVLYMIYMFLSVAFLFLGRVVTLWVSMIFAPLAFMSRALGIKALEDLSWDNWLRNLISSAFMAALFIFFLYIIILLGDGLKTAISYKPSDASWLSSMLSVIIPFAIIFTLLMKAKSLAVKYSGEMGSVVNKVGMAVTGLALGGAALGTAFAGRQTVGAFAKYSTNDDKRKAAIDKFNDMKWYQKANIFKSGSALRGGWSAKFSEFATGTKRDPTTGNVTKGLIGRGIDKATKTFKEKKEASDTISRKISEMSESLHIEKDAKFDDIPKEKAQKIKDAINADIVSKEMYKGRAFKELNDREKTTVRDAIIEEITIGPNAGKIGFSAVDTKGNAYGTPTMLVSTDKKGAGEILKDSKKNTSYYSAAGELIGSAAKGGYDIRNISKLSSKQLTMVVGLLAGIAGLLRGGLKQTHIDPGTGQKDFFKDLTSVITSAVKSSGLGSISSGGGHNNHADDHGHDDHGHGGGGGHH